MAALDLPRRMRFPGSQNIEKWALLTQRPLRFRSWRSFGLTMLLVALLPSAIILYFATAKARERIDRQSHRELGAWGAVLSRQIREEFSGLSHYVQSFASRPALRSSAARLDALEIEAHLRMMVENNRKISRAVFLEPEGRLRAAFPEDPEVSNRSFAHRPWFQRALASAGPVVSDAYRRAAFAGEEVVTIACAVRGNEGQALGCLGIQYLLLDLNTWLHGLLQQTPIEVVLADRGGNPVCDRNRLLGVLKKAAPLSEQARESSRFHFRFRDQEYLATRLFIPELEWTLFVLLPEEAAMTPVREVQGVILIFAALSTAVFLLVGAIWVQTLFRYAERVELSNQHLEYFCYSIAHNFRGPLRAIHGFADLLRGKASVDPEGADYLDRINASAQQLNDLVDDLLLFGKVSHRELRIQTIDTREAVLQALAEIEEEIKARDAVVELDGPFGTADADMELLRLLLKELLCNALKFVPPERRPFIRVESRSKKDRCLQIIIHDNGRGIQKAHIGQIYEIFHKLDMESPGTGVGLSIARNAVERMEGSISVTSVPSEGSSFSIRLPRP